MTPSPPLHRESESITGGFETRPYIRETGIVSSSVGVGFKPTRDPRLDTLTNYDYKYNFYPLFTLAFPAPSCQRSRQTEGPWPLPTL